MSAPIQSYSFIDDRFIETLDGVAKGIEPAQKVSDEPIFDPDSSRSSDAEPSLRGYVTVIRDEQEKCFKMWYNVALRLSDGRGETTDALAYAVSDDGIHWTKPVLNLIEYQGSTANNLIFPFFRWSCGHGVMKDPIEADPAKRYKMLFMLQCEHMQFAGICQPICVAYSADGINWNVPQNWLNPVIPRGTDTQINTYWDTKIHRYVVFLRGKPNVRIICMSESDDFENWSPRRIIVQPDEQDPPQDHEFYGMTAFDYGGFRIGFLAVFHTLYEGWIARNQIEPSMPQWMNQTDTQLTYSADGRTWHRAANREPILTCGPRGSFDSGNAYPAHAPIVVGDEVWMYYAGNNSLHGEPPRHGETPRRAVGLAKIRKDRFVCLKDSGEGVVTTAPLGIDPNALTINADADGGSLRAEVVTPFGQVLPGRSKDDCVPITADQTDHLVRWKNSGTAAAGVTSGGLEAKMVSQATGIYKLKIYMENAKLFAVYSGVSG